MGLPGGGAPPLPGCAFIDLPRRPSCHGNMAFTAFTGSMLGWCRQTNHQQVGIPGAHRLDVGVPRPELAVRGVEAGPLTPVALGQQLPGAVGAAQWGVKRHPGFVKGISLRVPAAAVSARPGAGGPAATAARPSSDSSAAAGSNSFVVKSRQTVTVSLSLCWFIHQLPSTGPGGAITCAPPPSPRR